MNSQHKRTIIKGAQGKALGCLRINCLPDDKEYEMRLKPYRKDRTAAQQALMWIWHKQWCDHFGGTVDAEHVRFKAMYLLPVLLRTQKIDGLSFLYKEADDQMAEGNVRPMQALYRMISTNWLDTKENAEILTQYQVDAAEQGCVFTIKNEWYMEAMEWGKRSV